MLGDLIAITAGVLAGLVCLVGLIWVGLVIYGVAAFHAARQLIDRVEPKFNITLDRVIDQATPTELDRAARIARAERAERIAHSVRRRNELFARVQRERKEREKIVFLAPEVIKRVNVERARRGAYPLNRDGFRSAVALASMENRPQPVSASDWVTYLILYECYDADHRAHTIGGHGGITIDPTTPYNGQGGDFTGGGGGFSGGGASGNWESANAGDWKAYAGSAVATGIIASDILSSGTADPPASPPAADPTPAASPEPVDTSPSYSDTSTSCSAPDGM